MINSVILGGRLTADPELKTTPSGISVTSFTIAVNRRFGAKNGEEPQADFINVTAWRQTAEFICRYFGKGQMIAVEGSIQTRNYEDKNGNKRTAFEVVANNVSFCGERRDQSAAPGSNTAPAAYSYTDSDEFTELSGDSDLPF